MTTAAKLPAAVLAQVDVGGEMAGIVTAVLSGAHNNSVTTITLTATVPASWPTAGWVTIDSEIVQYGGKSGSTLTGCTRGTQTAYGAGAAASHSDQATVGLYVTPQAWDQVVADLIETQVLMVKGVDIASATTLVPGTDGSYFHITGTTTITAITPSPAWKAGLVLRLEFDGALILTHNASSLILQGAQNYTTVAGDVFTFVSEGSGNWRETARRTAPIGTVVVAAFGSAFSGGVTNYTNPGNPNIGATTEATMQVPMARAGTLANLYLTTQTTQNAGGSMVITVRKNGVDTAVTVTVTAGATAATFSDTTHSVAFAAGDLLTIKVVNNYGGGASAVLAGYSFTYA